MHLQLNSRNHRARWELSLGIFFGYSLGLQSYMVSCLTALGYKPLPQHKFNNCYYLGFWLLCLQDIVNFFISAHLYMCMLSVLFLCQPIWDAVVDFHPQIFIWLGDNIYGDFKRPFKIFGQERTVGPWKNVPRFVLPLSRKWRLDMKKLSLILAMLDSNRMLRCFILSFSTCFCYLVDILIQISEC